MTANCPACKHRLTCPGQFQQEQQEKPTDCDRFASDPGAYWNRGWV